MSAQFQTVETGPVILFPATRRDGEAIGTILARESVHCVLCSTASEVTAELDKGAATLVLTDSALSNSDGPRIFKALLDQPQWSDLPVVLLRKTNASPEAESLMARMTNVTVLERPTSARTLVSAIRTSLRARLRQYQMRDHVAALSQAESALRQADRRKDEFLAMLAHELRNPLAPICIAAELLPRIVPPGDERADSTLAILKRQAGQLSRLVDDLLDVSRITQGRIELQHEILDLASVVAQSLESVEPLMTEKSHVVLRQAHMPTLHVSGDRARLVQCVSNILTNSAKYTDPHGKIEISLSQQGDSAVLSIQDNGIGMSSELLPRVFGLFVQSERSLDRSQGGLGIGLCVVWQLIEMHGGKVSARSAGAGQGSTLEIRLPLVASPATIAIPAERGSSRRRRVLVVDDNIDAADSLTLLLQLDGHDVKTAYGGEAGLDIESQFAPDFVLLDIGLPTINGYEVAKRLRARGTAAYLVALTGYGQPEDVRRAKDAGFDAHLVKPVDVDRVLEILGRDMKLKV